MLKGIFALAFFISISIAVEDSDPCSSFEQLYACGQLLFCMGSNQGMCLCASQQNCVWTMNGNGTEGCPCFGTEDQQDTDIGCLSTFYNNNCGYNTTCVGGDAGACECPDGSYCRWNSTHSENCPCTGSYPSLDDYLTEKFGQACMDQFQSNNCPYGYQWSCAGNIGNCDCKDGSMCSWAPGFSENCPCS